MRRRQLLAAAGGTLVTGVTAVAAVTASRARTPAQRAAQAAPPPRSTITAPVRRGRLTDSAVLDGLVARAGSVRIGVPRVRDVARLVVTRPPMRAGTTVRRGDVVAEVSGRPVIVLEGDFPAYRELSDGSDGPDVRQLRAALRPLYGTSRTGPFDGSVRAALDALYRRHGYRPVRRAGRTVLPVGEVAFAGSLPATVTEPGPAVGADPQGVLLTLAAGEFTVVATVPADAEAALDDGTVGFGAGPYEGRAATLLSVREKPGSDGQEPLREAVFRVTGRTAPDQVGTGQEVVLSRGGAAVEALIVPVGALWTDSGGSVAVTVVDGERRRKVPVRVRKTVLGESAVTGDLTENDLVLMSVP